jgi:MOSC domain-containing protein YiiM
MPERTHPIKQRGKTMTTALHLSRDQLEAGLDIIRQSPQEQGTLDMIVRRPQTEVRDIVQEGALDLDVGLVGDNWKTRGGAERPANPETQITLTNARTIQHIAQSKDRWALAGDQLYVDFDLSEENLPAGTRLSIGSAVLEITAEPHNGCKKFVERFGMDAMLFVNSDIGKALHLRGVNARVVQTGKISVGDAVRKL